MNAFFQKKYIIPVLASDFTAHKVWTGTDTAPSVSHFRTDHKRDRDEAEK